jgi:hypothetical protein
MADFGYELFALSLISALLGLLLTAVLLPW